MTWLVVRMVPKTRGADVSVSLVYTDKMVPQSVRSYVV